MQNKNTGTSDFAGKLLTKCLERKNIKVAKIVFNDPKHKKNMRIDYEFFSVKIY